MAVRIVALLIVAVGLQACATRGQVYALREDVATLREAVRNLQAQQLLGTEQSIRNELKTLGNQAIGLESRMADAAVQIGRLEARVGEAERAVRANASEVEAIRNSMEKLQAPPPSPGSASPPSPPPRRPPPAREVVAPRSTPSPEQMYATALATFRAREHGQAVLEFLDFINGFPRHPLAGNAQYWIGEAYYVQRDYRQAIVEFEKVLERWTSHPKAPDALLKIGMCHQALHDATKAVRVWRRVAHDYPKSEAATKARQLLHESTTTSRR